MHNKYYVTHSYQYLDIFGHWWPYWSTGQSWPREVLFEGYNKSVDFCVCVSILQFIGKYYHWYATTASKYSTKT